MSIREVIQSATADASRTQRMVRVIVTDDNALYALWRVVLPNGTRTEVSVPVGDVLTANITGRPAWGFIMDQIRDDTIGRTGA